MPVMRPPSMTISLFVSTCPLPSMSVEVLTIMGWPVATTARKERAIPVGNNNGIIKVYTVLGTVTNCPLQNGDCYQFLLLELDSCPRFAGEGRASCEKFPSVSWQSRWSC